MLFLKISVKLWQYIQDGENDSEGSEDHDEDDDDDEDDDGDDDMSEPFSDSEGSSSDEDVEVCLDLEHGHAWNPCLQKPSLSKRFCHTKCVCFLWLVQHPCPNLTIIKVPGMDVS